MKLAAIDIGSNSIHMVIAEATAQGGLEIIDREKEMVKLGAGVFRTHQLSERAFEAGVQAVRKYVKLADSHNVDEILAVATSATREAQNGGRFLDQIVQETGIEPRIIPGSEESELIFLAVQQAINLQNENALVIDIGGGSVEFAVGNRKELLMGESTKLGVQRLLDLVTHDGALNADVRKILEGHIKAMAGDILKRAQKVGFTKIIGTSGTIRTLGEATLRMTGRDNVISVNAEVIHTKDLRKLVGKLAKLKPADRTKFSPIGIERTDTIHLGGVLLTQLLKSIKAEQMTLCDASLREGVILDYLKRHPKIDIFPSIANVRHRSVVQLARKYERNGQREKHIAGMALEIFDQTQKLHGLGTPERSLLNYAALLHSIGQYINFKSYHRHSKYIISHAQLRGFTDEEVLLIGNIVRFHRKSEPQKSDEIKDLSKNQRRILQILAAMLRVAVGLDRGQTQSVKQLALEIEDKQIHIFISGKGDLELDLWGARRLVELLERALERKVVIEKAGD